MVVWQLKACPRCKGDLYPDYEFGSWDMVCLQCGYRMKADRQDNHREGLAYLATLTKPTPDPETADTAKVLVPIGAGAGSNQGW